MKSKEKQKNKAHSEEKPHKRKLDFGDEIKRLNRVIGQIEGIQKMLAAGRKLDDVVTQCKAAHSAIASVEQRVFRIHVDALLDEVAKSDKKRDRQELAESLEALFRKTA